MSPNVFKAIAAISLLIIALIGACGPLVLVKYGSGGSAGQRSLAFILGNMLSAGVMVSAGFVHLLGSAVEELPIKHKHGFPWAPFLCACGFLVTLVADQLATALSRKEDGQTGTPLAGAWGCESHGGQVAVGHEGAFVQLPPLPAAGMPDAERPSMELTPQKPAKPDKARGGNTSTSANPEPVVSRKRTADSNGAANHVMADSQAGAEQDESWGLLPEGQELSPPSDSSAWSSAVQAQVEHSQRKGRRREEPPGPHAVSFVTAVLMAIALCFHSVLEGAAVGAQDNVVDTAHIFIAIAAHKGLAAYALGSSLVDSQATGGRFWSVIATFAMATPVGIGLGMLLASVATGHVASGVSAVASGTFLYVAFMEVIPRELTEPAYRVEKLAMLLLGFSAMSVLAIWA